MLNTNELYDNSSMHVMISLKFIFIMLLLAGADPPIL